MLTLKLHADIRCRSKAVADGAIGFYCDHHVSCRMSKFIYGVEYLRQFNPEDPEHQKRQHRLWEQPSGPKLLLDAFDCILGRVSPSSMSTYAPFIAVKGVKVKESTVFTRKYSTELTKLKTLDMFSVQVWCYRGGSEIPRWIERRNGA